MMRILILLLSTLCSSFSYGQAADFNQTASKYLDKLEKSNLPAFFTACNTKEGKAFLIFGAGKTKFMLFEVENNDVVNAAPVLIKQNQIAIDIEETQGGIYTYTVMQNHARDMVRFPFSFIMPHQLGNILKLTPNQNCIDKPPNP